MCGIYFLYNGKKLVYVGQSVNIYDRVKDHLRDKKFNRVETFLCHSSELDYYEIKFIREMHPSLNIMGTGKRKSNVKPQILNKSLKKKKLIGIY